MKYQIGDKVTVVSIYATLDHENEYNQKYIGRVGEVVECIPDSNWQYTVILYKVGDSPREAYPFSEDELRLQ